MTAKEKAKELQNKHLYCYLNPVYPLHDRFDVIKASEQALVTVNEILESFMTSIPKHQMDFWEEVKQELKKL